MNLLMQLQQAEELLNNNDATVKGVLLSFIAILLFALWVLWKSNEKKDEYIKEQDKANLQMLSDLAKNSENLGNTANKIEFQTNEMRPEVKQILSLISQRLKEK